MEYLIHCPYTKFDYGLHNDDVLLGSTFGYSTGLFVLALVKTHNVTVFFVYKVLDLQSLKLVSICNMSISVQQQGTVLRVDHQNGKEFVCSNSVQLKAMLSQYERSTIPDLDYLVQKPFQRVVTTSNPFIVDNEHHITPGRKTATRIHHFHPLQSKLCTFKPAK
jgi:hypothetical protein